MLLLLCRICGQRVGSVIMGRARTSLIKISIRISTKVSRIGTQERQLPLIKLCVYMGIVYLGRNWKIIDQRV